MKYLLYILLFCSLSAQGQGGQAQFFTLNQTAYAFTDADAQNYIARLEAHGASVTYAQKGYIDAYFQALKSSGLWSKIYDRGLTIWGNAGADGETFKGINDLTWQGTVTHAAGFAVGNGQTGCANLNIIPSTALTLNNTHFSVYVRSNQQEVNRCDMGAVTVSGSQQVSIFTNNGGNLIADQYNTNTSIGRITVAVTTSEGYTISSRTSSTDFRAFRNGAQVGTTRTTASTAQLPTHSLYLMASNFIGDIRNFSLRQISLWSVGAGFSPAEAASDNILTEQLMDNLGYGIQ